MFGAIQSDLEVVDSFGAIRRIIGDGGEEERESYPEQRFGPIDRFESSA